MADHQKNTKFN